MYHVDRYSGGSTKHQLEYRQLSHVLCFNVRGSSACQTSRVYYIDSGVEVRSSVTATRNLMKEVKVEGKGAH